MFKFLLYALFAIFTYAVATSTADDTESIVPLLDERIVGGKEVNIINHPHQVSVRYKSCERCQFAHRCGGSIYNESVIITAAHCFHQRNSSNFMIVAGTNNLRGSDGIIVPVKKAVLHEKYNASNTDNDVAVVFLKIDIPINNVTIAPIKLASKKPSNGVKAIVTGWGDTTEGGVASETLQEVEVPIVSNDLCRRAYGKDKITDGMMCAGSPLGGKDACQGDSGGPLVVQTELAGIVSWGNGCAQIEFPGVYASVAHYKEWLEATIKNGGPPVDDELRIDFL